MATDCTSQRITSLWAAIEAYLVAGLSVIPADVKTKQPTVRAWKPYQEQPPELDDLKRTSQGESDAVAVICGKVSGGLELLDFDQAARAFDAWSEIVEAERPGLLERLVAQQTQSGGRHVLYRVDRVGRNQKLATDPAGKVLIETRGEGGYALVAPSPRYKLLQGDLHAIPTITLEEREVLFAAARACHEKPPTPDRIPKVQRPAEGTRPGDAYNEAADCATVLPILEQAGWTVFRRMNDRVQLTRPDKETGCSATLFDGGIFYVFSSNAEPFANDKAYSPFSVVALLSHAGDYSAAAKELARQGYGVQGKGGSEAGVMADQPGDERPKASTMDAAAEAESFLADNFEDDVPKVRFYAGEWYAWCDTCWQKKDSLVMRGTVRRRLEARYEKVAKSHVDNVLDALTARVILDGEHEKPQWIAPGEPPFELEACLFTRSEVIHLPSLLAEADPWKIAATPQVFSRTTLTLDYDPNAPPPPTWHKCLDDWFGDDEERKRLFQQWFGYSLTSDTSQQKLLLCVGPRRSGKGTAVRVLEQLVGVDNVASQTGSGLGSGFGLQHVVGKSLLVLPDAIFNERRDQSAAVERLLSITGEDRVAVERKMLPTISVRLAVKVIIVANELPKLANPARALSGRTLLLEFPNSCYGKEDLVLEKKLEAEYPGILNWAIQGLADLRAKGRFQLPKSAAEAMQLLEDLESPISQFCRDACNFQLTAWTSSTKIWEEWRRWCTEMGEPPGSREGFFTRLNTAGWQIKRKQKTVEWRKGRVWGYQGLGLRSQDEQVA